MEVMCNRTRASIKALQLLGNSVCGLDHASWCLVYNAICLPVLTYGCQLWFTNKQKTLVQKLQTVQNEAVRIIAGAFSMAPHEPLHQLLSILPMDLRLMMLTQNTALCLYRVLKESQLLKHLGGDWYTPGHDDLPLLIPNTNSSCMTLHSLTAHVSSRGPQVNPFLELPLDTLYWGGRVKVIPKQDNWDYKQVSESIVSLCKKGQTINIYSVGVLSNEHCKDGKQIRVCSAILYHQGQEWKHMERVLGETVTLNDTTIHSLSPTLEVLADFLSSTQVEPQCNTLVFLPSISTINRALDGSPHNDQVVIINFLK